MSLNSENPAPVTGKLKLSTKGLVTAGVMYHNSNEALVAIQHWSSLWHASYLHINLAFTQS